MGSKMGEGGADLNSVEMCGTSLHLYPFCCPTAGGATAFLMQGHEIPNSLSEMLCRMVGREAWKEGKTRLTWGEKV